MAIGRYDKNRFSQSYSIFVYILFSILLRNARRQTQYSIGQSKINKIEYQRSFCCAKFQFSDEIESQYAEKWKQYPWYLRVHYYRSYRLGLLVDLIIFSHSIRLNGIPNCSLRLLPRARALWSSINCSRLLMQWQSYRQTFFNLFFREPLLDFICMLEFVFYNSILNMFSYLHKFCSQRNIIFIAVKSTLLLSVFFSVDFVINKDETMAPQRLSRLV